MLSFPNYIGNPKVLAGCIKIPACAGMTGERGEDDEIIMPSFPI